MNVKKEKRKNEIYFNNGGKFRKIKKNKKNLKVYPH